MQELLDGPRRPRDDAPIFTTLLSGDGSGIVTLTLPDDGAGCLLAFTTPICAANYRQNLLGRRPTMSYIVSNTTQFLEMLRDIERIGVKDVTIDRCPRCTVMTAFGSSSMGTPDNVIKIWSVHKATELARTEAYLAWALKSAQAGRLEAARDVGLETVSHVTLEDPRLHVFLGRVAIALGDETLLQDAKSFLSFLKQDRLRRSLDGFAQRRPWDFSDRSDWGH
jgi:hypothetical protein